MKLITIKVTAKELELLASLASDQLFRREFIDPRMPGYRSNAEDVDLGKALVQRLRLIAAQEAGARPGSLRTANGQRFGRPVSTVE